MHNRPKTKRTFGIPERNQYNKSRSLLARDVPIILVEEKGHKDGSEFQVRLSRRQCNERTGLIVENRCQIGASLPLDVQCVAMCSTSASASDSFLAQADTIGTFPTRIPLKIFLMCKAFGMWKGNFGL